MKFFNLFTLLIITSAAIGQNSISNINVAQRTDGSQIVDVSYDISGTENFYIITPEVSFDGGNTYTVIDSVSGSVGSFIRPGNGKSFVWYFGKEFPSTFSNQAKVRISATGGGCGVLLTDMRDDQSYNTIEINGQCWMAENLNYGTMIQSNYSQVNNGIPEKFCYNDEADSCAVYGGYYQWNELMQYTNTEGSQGLCPEGWHVPTKDEYQSLKDYLGSDAGKKMKETGFRYWAPPNPATNESGFSAYGGGGYFNEYGFDAIFESGFFYTSTLVQPDNISFYLFLDNDNTFATIIAFGNNDFAKNVRCLKD